MKRISLTLASFVFCILTVADAIAAPALFAKGNEVFRIQNAQGKTPEYRVLDDSNMEKALALAIITTLNAKEEFQPKLPVREHIDMRLETLTLKPMNAKDLAIGLRLSGYDLEFEKTVDRARFLAGQSIEISFPTSERNVTFFSIKSDGRLRMRLNPKTNVIWLEAVQAKMHFESPLGGEGSEALHFTGRAIRR